MTVPTTNVTTTTTPALPLKALSLQPAVATPRRVKPIEVKKIDLLCDHHTSADATANTQENAENVKQVDGPAKSSDTTFKATPSTSGTAGKTKKRGRPQKNRPKKKTEKSTKTDATAETPQQAPEAMPEATPQVVNKTTPQKEGQEEYEDPVIPEPSLPTPPPDMVVAKVGQYSAEEIVKAPTKRRAADPTFPNVGEPLPKTPTDCPAFTPKETPLVALNPKKNAKKDRKGKEKEKEKPMKSFTEPTQAEKIKFENEERRTHAIESLLSKWSEPSKTVSHAPQDVDDDGMWGKLLVNRVKKIKDQEV